MKIIRILGIINAISLIILGILYFMKVQFPSFLLPIQLSLMVIFAVMQKKIKRK